MAQSYSERFYTLEEYYALEGGSPEKHEYWRGCVYLMAGDSANHAFITSNIVRHLGNLLDDKPCQVASSDLRIRVMANDLETYPDASVVCGPVDFIINRDNVITNPCLIVEVLSPSTESYDRGAKFEFYKGIGAFQDYLLVDSRQVYVTHYQRVADGWLQKTYHKLEDVVALENLAIGLKLAAVYQKIEFDPTLLR